MALRPPRGVFAGRRSGGGILQMVSARNPITLWRSRQHPPRGVQYLVWGRCSECPGSSRSMKPQIRRTRTAHANRHPRYTQRPKQEQHLARNVNAVLRSHGFYLRSLTCLHASEAGLTETSSKRGKTCPISREGHSRESSVPCA